MLRCLALMTLVCLCWSNSARSAEPATPATEPQAPSAAAPAATTPATETSAPTETPVASAPIYELRVYKTLPGKLPDLHSRFQNHTVGFFQKHGMKNVGYWTPAIGADQHDTLIYLLEHASPEAAKISWDAFRADPDWAQVRDASQKDGPILVEKGVKSTYLNKAEFSPAVVSPQSGKYYELRTYHAADGRLEDLKVWFRDKVNPIFQRHGLSVAGYWVPSDEPASQNTFIYLIEHDSPDTAMANWKAFLADAEWKAVKAESEKNGKLTTKPADAVYLKLTEYSPLR